jgi:hypothetical protein
MHGYERVCPCTIDVKAVRVNLGRAEKDCRKWVWKWVRYDDRLRNR